MCNQSLFKWCATYIIGEIIAKDNLNIENLMQTFKNLLLQNYSTKVLDITYKWSLGMCNQSLLKWWRHLHYWQNNSQRQFEHRKFYANL